LGPGFAYNGVNPEGAARKKEKNHGVEEAQQRQKNPAD
jgi:hypothetical protein